MFRKFRRGLPALAALSAVLAVLLVGPLSSVASASPAPTASPQLASRVGRVGSPTLTSAPFICASSSSSGGATSGTTASDYLPINRWGSAASDLHSNLSGGFFGLDNLQATVQRSGIETGALGVGNTLWRAATGLVQSATSFCIGDKLGTAVNNITATIGNAVVGSGLVAGLLVVAIVLALWGAARRGTNPLRRLAGSVLALGVLFAMIAGSTAGISVSSSGQEQFGVMSPAWLISTTFSVVNDVASLPATAFNDASSGLGPSSAGGPTGCGGYVKQLRTDYANSYPGGQIGASLPLSLDAMWEQTGLVAYTNTQFGINDPSNPYVYCRMLEANAGTPASAQKTVMVQAAGSAYNSNLGRVTPGVLSAADALSPGQLDRRMTAWAACQPDAGGGWSVRQGWSSVKNANTQSTISPGLCSSYLTTGSSGSGTALGWQGVSASSISNATSSAPGVGTFLLTLIGSNESSGVTTSILYVVASLVVFAAFAALALAIIVAKVALLVLGMLAALVVLIAIIPNSGMGNRALSLAKHGLGMVIFATSAQVVVSLIAVITGVIIEAGAGNGAFLDILATSFAPVAAIYLLHLLFTKILKAPSPMKPSSAFAYGAAMGGVGAELATGMDRLVSRSRSQTLDRATSRTTGAARNRFGAPRPDRAGALDPTSRAARLSEASGRPQPGEGAPSPLPLPGGGPGTPNPGAGPSASAGTGTATGTAGSGPSTSAGTAGGGTSTSSGTGTASSTPLPGGGPGGSGTRGSQRQRRPGNPNQPRNPDGTFAGDSTPDPGDAGTPGPPPGAVPPPLPVGGASGPGAGNAPQPRPGNPVVQSRRDEREGRRVAREAAGGRLGQAGAAVRTRSTLAYERARQRPVRTAAKAAAVVMAAGTLPFAAPAMAAVYGAHKVTQARRERRLDAPYRRQQYQEAGRAARQAREAAAEAAPRTVGHDEAVAATQAGIDPGAYNTARSTGASAPEVRSAHASGVDLGGYSAARAARISHDETMSAHTSGMHLGHYARARVYGATPEQVAAAHGEGIDLGHYATGRSMNLSHDELIDAVRSGTPIEDYLAARRPPDPDSSH